jgi:3-oxoacyl-[acyl-carrier-protein] synthase II
VRRVAITGLGAVSPVGNDVASTWDGLVSGRSGVGPITTFDACTFPVRIAGMVKDFDIKDRCKNPRNTRYLSRAAGFGVGAALEALEDSGLGENHYEAWERGVAMGGSVGRPELQEVVDIAYPFQTSDGHEFMRMAPSAVLQRDQNVGAATIGQLAGFEGPMIGVSTACTASAHAIGEACRRIQEGEAKVMLAGGYDALTSWMDVLGFSLLGALTTEYNDDPEHASRPFARDRSGFVLGEGGAVVVLEEWDAAHERGAKIYAELCGYGSSMNAYRITDAPPDGGGTILAMESAMADSGLRPEDVDYVLAHGTGTHGNDVSETMAIKRVYGDHAYKLAVSSVKSMTGHLTAAAGGLSLVTAVCALRHQTVPPTINLENPDPELDLDYTPNEARKREIRAVMINAFAFGGTNASMIIRSPEAAGA